MANFAPTARYERTRALSVVGIHLLTIAALWGQWQRVLLLVVIASVALSVNSLFHRRARASGHLDAVDDAKNMFNAVVVAVTCHLCGWPAPQWLFVPLNAMWLGERRRGSPWKLAFYVLIVAVPALVDGVSPILVASVALVTAIVFGVGAARDAVIALRTAELSAANAALAEAHAIARMGSYSFDPRTQELVWSDQLLCIFGLNRAPCLEQFFAMVHEDDRSNIERTIGEAVRTGQPFVHEYRALRRDGQLRWIYARGHVVPGVDGGSPRLIGTAQDVTDKKQMQARLLLSDRLAALGTLAGGIAHEINNPLAYVTANLDYLSEEIRTLAPSSQQLRELDVVLDETRQGAERVRRVVRDLRLFARDDPRSSDTPLHADLGKVLGFAFKMASIEIRHRARLVNDCAALPPVAASESRLGQLFLNLLINAAQSIPEGNVDGNQIRVSATRDGRGRLVVTVEDTGCGMTPSVQASIFDPFFTTKPTGSGMGLGLSICHTIVSDFGGEISVHSELGKGSAFSVAIPLAQVADATAAEPAADPPAARRGRILIIDDDPLVAASLRRTLADHDVELVHSGQDAVARLTGDAPFDVVLCDLLMPDLTGMDVYERLLAVAPAAVGRMVFMTGGAFTLRAREFLARVPNPRFDKPVDSAWLRAFVADQIAARVDSTSPRL